MQRGVPGSLSALRDSERMRTGVCRSGPEYGPVCYALHAPAYLTTGHVPKWGPMRAPTHGLQRACDTVAIGQRAGVTLGGTERGFDGGTRVSLFRTHLQSSRLPRCGFGGTRRCELE